MDCSGGWTPYGYNYEEPLEHHAKMVKAGLADIGYFEVTFGGAGEAHYVGRVLRRFDIKTEGGTTFKMHLTRTLSDQEVRHRAGRPPPRVMEENRPGEVAGTRGEQGTRQLRAHTTQRDAELGAVVVGNRTDKHHWGGK